MVVCWTIGIIVAAVWVFFIGAPLFIVLDNIIDIIVRGRRDLSDLFKYILIAIVFALVLVFVVVSIIFVSIGSNSVKFDLVTADNLIYKVKFYYMVEDTSSDLSLFESLNIRASISYNGESGYHQRIERFFENTFNNILPYKPTVEDIERICNTLDNSLLDLPNATFKLKFKNIKFVEAF